MGGIDDDQPQTASERLWSASRTAARLLSNERPVTAGERLAALAASPHAAHEEAADVYGDGIVERLEARIAELLNKPAALWFPSGTMAQQAILQVWAARSGSARVAVHPLHHTQLQEEDAFARLSGFEAVHPTTARRHPTADELRATAGPLAAAVLELPMQELGYVLPTWEEYTAFAEAARERSIPLHVDGARIWESRTRFAKTLPEIAAEASSLYVSLYKGVGGLSGAAIAASADVVDDARIWRTRYGGDLFRQFPAIIAALDGLDARLDRMDAWVRQAAVVADGLRRLPELHIEAGLPHINEFWVSSELPAGALNAAVLEHLETTGDRWLHGWWSAEGRSVAEATIRDDALAWTAEDVAAAGRAVLDRARTLVA